MPHRPYVEAWLAGPDGHSFYTRTYQAPFPKAVAVFVHGFRDHISRHEDVHAAFARRHVSIFAYDLRGYGRTALDPMNRSPGAAYGKTSRGLEIQDLEWWIKHVSETNKRLPLFLMGFSGVSPHYPRKETQSPMHSPPGWRTSVGVPDTHRTAAVTRNRLAA